MIDGHASLNSTSVEHGNWFIDGLLNRFLSLKSNSYRSKINEESFAVTAEEQYFIFVLF